MGSNCGQVGRIGRCFVSLSEPMSLCALVLKHAQLSIAAPFTAVLPMTPLASADGQLRQERNRKGRLIIAL